MPRNPPVDLYRPDFEHDACGVGLVVDIAGRKNHALVRDALRVLANMEHRGAEGAERGSGDGAGVMTALPHRLFVREGVIAELPAPGDYAVAMVFLPQAEALAASVAALFEDCARDEALSVLGWRDVPMDLRTLPTGARSTAPRVRQLFVTTTSRAALAALDRATYLARKTFERRLALAMPEAAEHTYVCSFSSRTIVYKGLLTPEQLSDAYLDLQDPSFESAFALVHQRFSTNTFPAWKRAHPYRFIAHNGEINTLRGNVNWMRAREETLAASAESPQFAGEIAKLRPIIDESGSDSAMLDNALELIMHTGRSLPHAMTMLVPEAWENDREMPADRKAFFGYHACFMEPWDGPAAVLFSDGRVCGATLDRNGLRPARVVQTTDGRLIIASESGVLPIPEADIVRKDRLRPGQMLLVDLERGLVLDDSRIKDELGQKLPYRRWLDNNVVWLHRLPNGLPREDGPAFDTDRFQTLWNYTAEELRLVLQPMAANGEEPTGSMGNDAPPAFLSSKPQLLSNYFRQLFAQVTNPPIDSLREARVMSLTTALGAEANLFEDSPQHCRKLVLKQPILSDEELGLVKAYRAPGLHAVTLDTTFAVRAGAASIALSEAVEALCAAAERAVDSGATILVLSDRAASAERAPIPALLAVSAVHHHLIRVGRRTRAGLIVESGEPREVMHFCLLLGFGAGAINPYLALASVNALVREGRVDCDEEAAQAHFIKAVGKGLLKVMAKMGVSTLASYRGAQLFEALGLNDDLIDRYFTRTPTRLGRIGMGEIAAAYAGFHAAAFAERPGDAPRLPVGGVYQWRREGEHHAYGPELIGALQHAVRSGRYELFQKFSALSNTLEQRQRTIRGLVGFKPQRPIALDEVEPVSAIVRRFKTGAMSLGSISKEAHENLAVAMNRIGGRSNTGEGGEDPARFVRDSNGDSRRSAIKQVASGRFGVTMGYLTSADELQIKMAQGAKPGEGGQLPGHKVSAYIAELRHSTPGVTLVSPPPHHDIYSIEDLAQLIYDLRAANDAARISVKLVSEVGVGTVAAGVAKARADVIVISGDAGGTGAAPLSSIKHAGAPWELGLAEAHQTLLKNGLRERVVLETDGQLKTGRDVAVAALLGAEEFGFATAALVASGCVMMRVCHLNTCPVGIATQDPELRRRFAGEPEHVINFMGFVAQELREIMASLGLRSVDEMVGRADLLVAEPGFDFDAMLALPETAGARHFVARPKVAPARTLDDGLIARALDALLRGAKTQLIAEVSNRDRAVGTRLSSEVVRAHGSKGLEPGSIDVSLTGTAGQSFGAYVARGISLRLEGDANDYFGKGLCGGRLVVVPSREARFVPEANMAVGNTALYGATSGEAFVRGMAGERFAVRNSGATAVVEGVGDHGCEYMTGGRVLVIGPTGRNFAAGMSGGIAWVHDPNALLERRVNLDTVVLETPPEDELAAIKQLLRAHFDATESQVAWRLLSDFGNAQQAFVRVMPKDFKQVLAARRAREAAVLHG